MAHSTTLTEEAASVFSATSKANVGFGIVQVVTKQLEASRRTVSAWPYIGYDAVYPARNTSARLHARAVRSLEVQ